jgi:hypothetical protein
VEDLVDHDDEGCAGQVLILRGEILSGVPLRVVSFEEGGAYARI